jgi:hypothetical protein
MDYGLDAQGSIPGEDKKFYSSRLVKTEKTLWRPVVTVIFGLTQ